MRHESEVRPQYVLSKRSLSDFWILFVRTDLVAFNDNSHRYTSILVTDLRTKINKCKIKEKGTVYMYNCN